MSHDVQAAWATVEVVRLFRTPPTNSISITPTASAQTIFAGREGRSAWPFADGVIRIERAHKRHSLALEYKRENEGLHGVLTAVGQAHAYLNKGYAGAIIVVPKAYPTHGRPGEYVAKLLEATSPNQPIGVFSYSVPDTASVSPFRGRLECHRQLKVDLSKRPGAVMAAGAVETQWAHLREGSTTPSAFYRYLQTAKTLIAEGLGEPGVQVPVALDTAAGELRSDLPPEKFLSNSRGDSFHDKVWRHFWFKFVFTEEVMPLFRQKNATYILNDALTRLHRADGTGRQAMFFGRADSIKNQLIQALQSGHLSEAEAWKVYAANVSKRAHSFREDVDSGLDHLDMLEEDGRPSDIGYRFVDAAERNQGADTGLPKGLLGAALLKNGQLAAFLHYVHRLSEQEFKKNPLSFSKGGGRAFDQSQYLHWLEARLTNDLAVMRKVSLRGGVKRRPFQGELAILRLFDFVRGFRVGVGLEINWPAIQESLQLLAGPAATAL